MGLATAGPICEPPTHQESNMAKAKSAPTTPDSTDAGAVEPQSYQPYVAKTHINHDGVDYFEGDPIELAEQHAKTLRECGAIEAAA